MDHTTVTPQHVQQAWLEMPHTFRELHPLPTEETHAAAVQWLTKVCADLRRVVLVMLDVAQAEVEAGNREAARIAEGEVRPFVQLMRVLDAVADRWEKAA